jgi:hypothetical protein
MAKETPPEQFESDVDCRRTNAPVRPNKSKPDTGSDKVFRTDIDSRRIHQPIHLPDSSLRNIIEVSREIVPIIFIPGIMGSRLQNTNGNKVWDPDSKIFMLAKFGAFWQSAKKRKDKMVGNAFDSEYLSVIEDDASHNKKFTNSTDRTRAERGWGGVGWSSYGEFLIALQNKQWEPLLHLNFMTPVHAFGYNWTACNNLAGKELATYIDKTIAFYNRKEQLCERVILVTHSMGGLVARAACKIHSAEDKVIGVIHGVQPAMGSAAGYWRMKGGFERPHTIPELDGWQWLKNPSKMVNHKMENLITKGFDFNMGTNIGLGNVTAWVLGTDGEEVTSLLGNMPGGLELLPNKQYRDNDGNKQWLVFVNPDGKKTRLPKSDPYKEIYRCKEEFYRLVNPEWLAPCAEEPAPGEKSPWDRYLDYLSLAEAFHEELKDKIHHDTYQFYSTGIASTDRVVFVRTLDTWGTKGKRLLEVVKNEWFDKAKSTAVGEARGKMVGTVTNPVKHALFEGLSWKDMVFNPSAVIDTAKRLPKAVGDVPGVLGTAIKGYPGAVPSIAMAIGKGLVLAAATNAVGLFVRDTEWYINRGGYRDKVDEQLKPHSGASHTPDDLPAEVVYIITMNTPDGAGDGTVPESSARALNPFAGALVKYDRKGKKIRRTFAIGDVSGVETAFTKKKAPRTKPKSPPEFDEAWFDRGHEPIYKTKSAQHITFTVIESICRRRIAQQKGRK